MEKLIPKDEYITMLEKATGLSSSRGEFGFILGTHAPFVMTGLQSAANRPGYCIYRGDGNGMIRELWTTGMTLQQTALFLTLEGDELNKFLGLLGKKLLNG